MKNFVRVFALSLVATGAFASTQINNSTANVVAAGKISAMPVPTCPPNDPNACNMANAR